MTNEELKRSNILSKLKNEIKTIITFTDDEPMTTEDILSLTTSADTTTTKTSKTTKTTTKKIESFNMEILILLPGMTYQDYFNRYTSLTEYIKICISLDINIPDAAYALLNTLHYMFNS
jgi:ERCC4-type nuclease